MTTLRRDYFQRSLRMFSEGRWFRLGKLEECLGKFSRDIRRWRSNQQYRRQWMDRG